MPHPEHSNYLHPAGFVLKSARIFCLAALLFASGPAFAQTQATQTQSADTTRTEAKPMRPAGTTPAGGWTLKRCLEHAHANSLQLKQADLRIQESEYSRKQSLAAMFPAVNASTSIGLSRQNIRNSLNEYMSDNTFNARYNIGASMTVFNGLRQYHGLQQQELNTRMQQLGKEEQQFQLDLDIIRACMQIAYLQENIRVLETSLASAESQLQLAGHKLKAGSLAPSEHAQFAARCSDARYQLVCGHNLLNAQLLELKQLLELDMSDSLHLISSTVDTALILSPLPDRKQLCAQALQRIPACRSRELNLRMAELDCRMARAGYFPSLTLAASIGTGNWFDGAETFVTQLNDNLNQSIGLSLNIPVFNGLQTRTAVQKALLNRQEAELERHTAEKELLVTVEGLYNDALAAQSQYIAAKAQSEAAEAGHRLTEEQFRRGIKSAVELLISSSDCLNAAQNLLQAKYTAALAVKLLQYYQGLPIE